MSTTSINPDRTSPYSEDLRWHMIWQRVALGYNVKAVASNLGVDPSTVSRTVRCFYATGDVHKKPYPKDARPNKKLTSPVQLTILHTMLQHPEIYLHELRGCMCAYRSSCKSSLCTFLNGMNFTRQKMQIVAKQRDDDLREQFFIDVSLYKPEMLIFIDESGSDNRDTLRKYGYCIRGKPPRSLKLLVRGERVSVIAAMSNDGVET